MLKLSHFAAQTEQGVSAIPLFGKSDVAFEKCASSGLLPDVTKYINSLRPQNGSQYVLVNAMGAGEYFGSNINGDHFPEASLVHIPPNWTGVPLIDKAIGKNWAYGFPTFYNAHPYAHHRNKDSSRAFGEVELATWNPRMKRVELVVRVDYDKCDKFGGMSVWDKLKIGSYPDVSMGTKVPYDNCSICLDSDAYNKGLATYKPGRHQHPGQAALQYHKESKANGGKGIRGLSITRNDYCEHAKSHMNKILPDGRKVWVYNDYPRFFDISFVFIGADKTAKVMLFVHRNGVTHSVKPSAQVADEMGLKEASDENEKVASVDEELLKAAFGKLAKPKSAEITKQVVPSQFAGKAIPVLNRSEPSIDRGTLDQMGNLPLSKVLSTTAGMGIVLRPQEFQRLSLARLGAHDLADELDDAGDVFPRSECSEHVDMGAHDFMPSLARLLSPLMSMRSALGPVVEQRVIIICGRGGDGASPKHSARRSELLDKISSAYNGYREQVIDIAAHSSGFMQYFGAADMQKMASAEVSEMFTPLTVSYLKDAFLDEFGVSGL